VIDLTSVAELAALACAQILLPLFWYVAAFIGALYAVLSLILWFVDLLE